MIAPRPFLFTLVSLLTAGSTAWAASGFLPDECTAFLTVQSRSCSVVRHYTCPSSPGDRWAISYTAEGPFFLSRIDAEAQWIEARDLPDGVIASVMEHAIDPSSITTLLETGRDDYTFEEHLSDGRVIRYEGFDRLTGETVEIDGEPLLATSFRYREIDPRNGALIGVTTGHEFVSERHRRFFSGVRTSPTPDGDMTTDGTPVEFVYPGEAGFTTTTPIHGCGGLLSALSIAEEPNA